MAAGRLAVFPLRGLREGLGEVLRENFEKISRRLEKDFERVSASVPGLPDN